MAHDNSNRNASPSYFGWEFQIASAIVLALRYIHDLSFILVENQEDIELGMTDGGKVYAQAKAHFRANEPGDGSLGRLEGGLKTLNDSFGRPDCRELIYITNDMMPFGKSASDLPFGRRTFLKYKELSEKQREAIARILSKNSFDVDLVDKLAVYGVWYYGNDEQTCCEEIDALIRDFLDSLGFDPSLRPPEDRLRGDWMLALGFSAGVDPESLSAKKVSKSAFAWPVVVESCMGMSASAEELGIDDDQFEELSSMYSRAIDAQVDRFDAVSRVMTDYSEYSKSSGAAPRQMRLDFLRDRWRDYVSLFGADAIDDEEIREAFVCAIVSRIIKKKEVVKKVKNGVNLPD